MLTGSTHKESQAHVQPSPKPAAKPMPPPPPKPALSASSEEVSDPGLKLPTKAEPKSRFGPIFKIPNLGKSQDNPKSQEKKQETPEPVVRRREVTREISNPVLISTTDRRSQHLVKVDNLQVAESEDSGVPLPPVPPKISLNRSDSDFSKKNKPLPPRPVSMPMSDSGEEIESDVREARKSMNLPQRPPPPVKTAVAPDPQPSNRSAVSDTRQTIEAEISKLDEIKVEIPAESGDESKNVKPSALKSGAKKPLKPKTPVKKSTSDSAKKPLTVTKRTATETKADSKSKGHWTAVDKPIFKSKDKPVLKKTSHTHAAKAEKSDTSAGQDVTARKASTESLDDEGDASVYARKKIFEGQKKPLLGAKSEPEKTAGSIPQTPPKPGRTVGGKTGGKQIRSVNV